MHGTGGPSGKTLPLPELVELAGPAILGALNATNKVGTLLGGRPIRNITCPEIVDTVTTDLTTPTEERQERKGEAEGVLQAPNHSDGSILITTSDPREDRESATLTTVDISGRD